MATAVDGSRGFHEAPLAAVWLLAVVGIQLVSSVRFFFKYVETLPWLAYATYVVVGLLACLAVLRSAVLLRFVSSRAVLGVALGALLALVAVAYPKADALRAVGRGSDQDDCVRELVSNVFALRAPFGRGYFGDPCSTGPGELFVYFPVQLGDWFFVVVPVLAMLLGHRVLLLIVSRGVAVLLSLTQLSSGLFLELSAVGSDLVVIAWLFAAATTASFEGLRRGRAGLLVVGGAAYVLFASSRLPFVVVTTASLAVLVLAYGKRVWRLVAPVAALTTALYVGSHAIAPDLFTPGHLIGKSGRVLHELLGVAGTWALVATVVLSTVAVTVLLRGRIGPVARRNHSVLQLVLVTAPMVLAAAWDIERSDYDLARWEGLHYVHLGMPMLLVVAAQMLTRSGWAAARPP
jgi:hypothetical protein